MGKRINCRTMSVGIRNIMTFIGGSGFRFASESQLEAQRSICNRDPIS
jgi:hypothetical protein